jgi:hypothetical protein
MKNIQTVTFRAAASVATVCIGALGFSAAATAQGAPDLAGKTIEFVIPFSESGGSAKWANFYAPLLQTGFSRRVTKTAQ